MRRKRDHYTGETRLTERTGLILMPTDPRTDMTDDVELRRLAIRRADMKLAFRSHLMAYVLVNAALVAINLITSPEYFWAIWPMMGWGIGLAVLLLATGDREGALTFQCRLDGGSWTACSGSVSYANVALGLRTVAVRAIDAAGNVDPTKPLLTYSRPKGDYKGDDANAIMIDFWLANAKLVGDGGEYRIRFTVDGGDPGYLDKWMPVWLTGWTSGKHSVKLELVDKDGNLVDNGGYNSTTREITITK